MQSKIIFARLAFFQIIMGFAMWFRNLCIYQLDEPMPYQPEALIGRLEDHAFQPCDSHTFVSAGWVAPQNQIGAPLVYAANGIMMICLKVEEKLLPAAVVREEVQKRVSQIEIEQSRKVGKKEKIALKEEIYFSLLPRAFSKSSLIYAYFDTKTDRLLINVPARNKAEFFISTLRKALGSLKLSFPEVVTPSLLMTRWLKNNVSMSEFQVSDQCLLQNSQQQQGKIRCQNQNLFAEGVQSFLKENFSVMQIALTWQEQVSFVLSDDFSLKNIKFLETVKEMAHDAFTESDADRFDASFVIMTGTLNHLLEQLFAIFADEEEPSAQPAKKVSHEAPALA